MTVSRFTNRPFETQVDSDVIAGINEGKFLERNQYKNADRNNQIFSPEDLIVGCDIKINGYSFHITDCDMFTKKWYAENTVRVPIEEAQQKP
jgi:hypothetical protein